MTNDALRLLRNILLRSTLVGMGFALLLGVATIAGWEHWIALASRWFHTSEAVLAPLVIRFFIDLRFFLLFILLTPALAIHWTLQAEKSQK